jgi:HK97 family phage portal protein
LGLLDIFKKKMIQYVYSYQYGRPLWSTQKDEAYIKEAYNKIVWVYSCVAMISSCVSSVPWCLYRKLGNGDLKEITDHPLLKIVNNQINPHFSSKDFFDLWSTYLALQGKFYAQYNNAGLPTELYILYPHNVKPIPNQNTFISSFEYNIGEEKTILRADQVLWSKFNDPLDLYQGLSPIKALSRTIDTENEAVDWNKNSLQNSAIPPGAISIINPPPDIQSKIREDWLNRYSGKNNIRVPIILNAEKATYEKFGLSPIDMDFLNQRKLNRIEICSAFGVPSQVVGDPEGQTYANYEEALKAFWENTVIPRYLEIIKDALNRDLVVRYADNLVLNYNLDDVQVLHESIDAIAERVRGLFKDNLLTQNEARFALGYEELPEGDMFNFDISAKIMQNMADSKEEKEGEEVEDTEDDKDKETNKDTEKDKETEDDKEDTQKKSLNLSADEKIKYWKAFDNQRLKYENYLQKKTKELFNNELKQINALKSTKENYYKDITNIIDKNKKNWQTLFVAFYIAVVKDFGEQTWRDVQKKKSIKAQTFDVYDSAIKNYIKTVAAKKITGITKTSKDRIKNVVEKGLDEGLEMSTIAGMVKNTYEESFMIGRATTIARTEVIGASNYGSLEGAKQSGADVKKIWIATLDERTRPSHADAGFHPPIKTDEYFNVNGTQMEYPGDPNGGDESVNCRCAIGYVDE